MKFNIITVRKMCWGLVHLNTILAFIPLNMKDGAPVLTHDDGHKHE